MGGKDDKKKDKKDDKKDQIEEEEDKLELWSPEANDQLTRERGNCLTKDKHVKQILNELETCQRRVKGKDYTAETCHQEMKDLFMAVDHCVGSKAFNLLK